jgi:hypothetical protein
MADAPHVKVTGQGSHREATALGQQIVSGVSSAVSGVDHALHFESLRLQLLSGATQADINRAIRRAIARHGDGARR